MIVDAIRQAIQQAKADKERPSFIVVKRRSVRDALQSKAQPPRMANLWVNRTFRR
mgnify:CR=1 FL=1